jgi:hypothetical protein
MMMMMNSDAGGTWKEGVKENFCLPRGSEDNYETLSYARHFTGQNMNQIYHKYKYDALPLS